MRRIFILVFMLLGICSLTGCGEDDTVERAEQKVIEVKDDAEQVVDENNEKVQSLEDYMKDKE